MTSPACSNPVTHWSSQYVGLPFQALGRDRSGLDCYGLVCLVYQEQFGIELPDYCGRYGGDLMSQEVQNLFALGMESPHWSPVEKLPRDGDVVILQVQGHAYHVAIMLDRWRMLHAREGSTVTIERINSTMWRKRILGYYRHRDMGHE